MMPDRHKALWASRILVAAALVSVLSLGVVFLLFREDIRDAVAMREYRNKETSWIGDVLRYLEFEPRTRGLHGVYWYHREDWIGRDKASVLSYFGNPDPDLTASGAKAYVRDYIVFDEVLHYGEGSDHRVNDASVNLFIYFQSGKVIEVQLLAP